jgi:hypothetical protein
MKDPSRANDGEQHVPTVASEDGGALGEAAMAGSTGRRHDLSKVVYIIFLFPPLMLMVK